MSTTRRLALACTALLALALLPSAASATVAMNDSVELDQVLALNAPVGSEHARNLTRSACRIDGTTTSSKWELDDRLY